GGLAAPEAIDDVEDSGPSPRGQGVARSPERADRYQLGRGGGQPQARGPAVLSVGDALQVVLDDRGEDHVLRDQLEESSCLMVLRVVDERLRPMLVEAL